MTDEQTPEGPEPMTAETAAPPATEPPFPIGPEGVPVPPPPTREEAEERARRWREQKDREEHERANESAVRLAEAKEGAKEAIRRLMALDEEQAAIPEDKRPRGIAGVEYLIADLTQEKATAARKVWERDLDVVRNLNAENESLTTWRVADIEDPAARGFVDRFVRQLRSGAKKKNLIVVGSVGAGKTATAIAAGHLSVDLGMPTRYVSHSYYLECLRPEGVPPNGLSKDQFKRSMIAAHVLVLDDFCADMNVDAPASEFARRETIALLNARMTQGKANIVTTNVTTEQVRKMMDDRIASRLGTNAVVVTMADRDRREPTTW
jgi:DNA replication protein DnaC